MPTSRRSQAAATIRRHRRRRRPLKADSRTTCRSSLADGSIPVCFSKPEAMNNSSHPFGSINVSKIILPIVIGLGVVAWLFWREFDPKTFDNMIFTWKAVVFLLLAFILMFSRDFGYMIRIRVLSDNRLTWRQAFRIIMLWEFTSSVTPSAIGGTSVAILFVNKEGISLGKSSSIVLATSFLDELYFIVMFPILLLTVNINRLFTIGDHSGFINEFFWFAIIGYSIKLVYTIIVSYGLFINPRGLKWLLLQIFRLPFLKRWKHQINEAGYEIIVSSNELRRKPFMFWVKAFGSTAFSWTSRYWVANMIILAFFFLPKFGDHFLIFARQFVMWIMQLIAPTPGGSGFAEGIFTRYLGDVIPVNDLELAGSLAVVLALVWRLISYYPYLIVGAFIVPKWIKNKFADKTKATTP
ncbi:MAG: flippase-like domain-containing protein [Bacteroidales bacterium]|jgi:uncharacterized protein (TIRG00374 family)|nr:flippase-like domain-containing protein [Bacteroidales bacterium]